MLALHDPRQTGEGLEGAMAGFWRCRVGAYRIACKIEGHRLVVVVVKIGHRREIYR